MKVLALANYKGGVGKSAIATNLSAAVAREGKIVVHLDFDFQGNSTEALGADRLGPGLSDFLQQRAELGHLIQPHPKGAMKGLGLPDLFILPPGPDLEIFQATQGLPLGVDGYNPSESLIEAIQRLNAGLATLNSAAQAQGKPITLVVLDTRPDFGWNTALALGVAHSVLVPLEAHESSVSGLEGLLSYVERIKSTVNPELDFLGAFINKWYKIDKSQVEVIKALRSQLKAKLFSTVVGLSTHISQGYATRTPAVHAYPDSGGAKYIRDLAKTVSSHLDLEGEP